MIAILTDAELIALAALVQVEAMVMAGDNEQSRNEGYSPAWRSGTGLMPHTAELEDELERRKKAREELSLVRFERLQEQAKAMCGRRLDDGIMEGRVPIPVPLPHGDMPATEVPTPRDCA